jgi:hypothetical protein
MLFIPSFTAWSGKALSSLNKFSQSSNLTPLPFRMLAVCRSLTERYSRRSRLRRLSTLFAARSGEALPALNIFRRLGSAQKRRCRSVCSRFGVR